MSTPRRRRASGPSDDVRRCQGCGTLLAADNTTRLCGRCHREQRDQLRTPPVFDDEFWTTDDLRAAFESRNIGRVFSAYRHHPRHLKLFGKALNQELLGRWLRLTQPQISRLEKGLKEEHNFKTLAIYAQILNIPQEMLWFDLPGQTRVRSKDTQDQTRLVLPSNSLALPDAGSFSVEITGAGQLSRVSKLTSARLHFERMYRNSGGLVTRFRIEQFLARQSLPFALQDTSDVADKESRRAIGGLIALAGVCAYDSEDWAAANSYFFQALNIAKALDDRSFHGYVLALMTNQALAMEDFRAAHNVSSSALAVIGETASPIAVDLQVMKVKALAFMGDSSSAVSGIRELENSFNSSSAAETIAEASYAQAGHLQAGIAEALISLGDIQGAEHYAETSIKSNGHARGRVNQLASLATLEISRGEIDRAAVLASEMVDTAHGMESRRLVRRFIEIRNSLAKGAPSVSRDAVDKIDDVVALLS